jgi:hypothetical protein
VRALRRVGLSLVIGLAGTAGAWADGGLGFQPAPFLADILQPDRPTPYHAVCHAPPETCPIEYMYPIKAGKPCWCRAGLFVYSGGVTQSLRPLRPVYKP